MYFLFWWVVGTLAKPQNGWICLNCIDGNQSRQVFGMVRHAMQFESREVYLPFDHSWIDTRALDLHARVVVTLVPRQDLTTMDYNVFAVKTSFPGNDHRSLDDTEMDPLKEVFHVVVSLPPPATSTATAPTMKNYPDFVAEVKPVDTFLRRNPCFIPLHDPPVDVGKDESVEAFGGPVYRHSAVFIRLPALHFYSTCQLYTLVTQLQHPEICPTLSETDKYLPAAVGTIGWSNAVGILLGILTHALHANKVFIATHAHGDSWETTKFFIDIKGVRTKMNHTWLVPIPHHRGLF